MNFLSIAILSHVFYSNKNRLKYQIYNSSCDQAKWFPQIRDKGKRHLFQFIFLLPFIFLDY